MIRYYLENPDWTLERATSGSSGYDLRAHMSTPERTISVGERWLISTGLYLEMPLGLEAQVRSRSGLAINHGVIVLNAPGTIDADYRGEVKVSLINLSKNQDYVVHGGDKIAQLVFAIVPIDINTHTQLRQNALGFPVTMDIRRVSSFDELSVSERGSGGHGSTGR